MKKYWIMYYFDGEGRAIVEADSEKEAEEKWFEGDFDDKTDDSWGDNYTINTIEDYEDTNNSNR